MVWTHGAARPRVLTLVLATAALALVGGIVLIEAASSRASGAVRAHRMSPVRHARSRSAGATAAPLTAQKITFVSTPPPGAMVGSAYTVSATATSGLPVTFSIPSTSASACSIAGSKVTFTGVGQCTVEASQAGNATYAAATARQLVPIGHLYWVQEQGLGRVDLDGNHVNQNLVSSFCASGVAVDGKHIYWSNICNGTIGEANLDGSDANSDLVTTSSPRGMAVDRNYIYWSAGNGIDRANLDGTEVNGTYNFIATSNTPDALAVDGKYIYWTSPGGGSIGRASLTGSGVNASFIPAVFGVIGVAVDGQHLYWTETSGLIGRANLNGTGVDQQFITTSQSSLTGLAVDGAHIYWIDSNTAVISRANLAGSSVEQAFVSGVGTGGGLLAELGPATQPAPRFTSTAPSDALVGQTYTVSTSAGGGSKNPATVIVDPASSAVCAISKATVKFIARGRCTLDADQAGNASYFESPQAQQGFGVHRGTQTITFTSKAPTNAVVGGHYTVAAKASSGLPVALKIDNGPSPVCSMSGATVTFKSAGTCTIDANQGGNTNYLFAPQVQQSVTVGPAPQTITFTSSLSSAKVGQHYTVQAAASPSRLPVAFKIPPFSGPYCSISGVTVTFKAIGTCTIDANQSGDANYKAAPQVQQKIPVTQKASQTIIFTSVPAGATVGHTYTVSAKGGPSGNPVTFTIAATSAAVCSISGAQVTITSVGSCTVYANQAGNTNYDAAPQAKKTFSVGHLYVAAGNEIGRSDLDGSHLNQGFVTGTNSASAVAVSGSSVYWANYNAGKIGRANLDGSSPNENFVTGLSQPEGVAVAGNYVYWTDAGTGNIGRVALDGTGANPTFITGADHPSSIAVNGSHIYWSNSFGDTIGRAKLDGKNPNQSFISTGGDAPADIALDTAYIYWTSPGNWAIGRASLDGSGADPNLVNPSDQPLGIAVDGAHIYWSDSQGDTIFELARDGSGTSTSLVAGLSGAEGLTLNGPTTQAAPTFTSTAPTNATVDGPTYTPSATSQSGGPVTFSIDPASSSVCSISGTTISFNDAGTCTVLATQLGTESYFASPTATQSFSVGPGAQAITFTSSAPTDATVGGPTYSVSANASPSGLPVSFTIDSTSSSVCSTSGSMVSFSASGTCTIDANQAGDANWQAAPQAQQSFSVGPASQSISFSSSPPASASVGDTYTPTANASSGLAVSFTIDPATSSNCSISGSTVTFTSVGTCTVDANQAGNANYLAASQVTQSITVGHIYWAVPGNFSIGRANLDGGNNGGFISDERQPDGIAVDGSYVYWADQTGQSSGSIAKANADGSNVNTDFIPGLNDPKDVVVDGSYIYWSEAGTSTIGRADLNGENANPSFITGTGSVDQIAIFDGYIYWTNQGAGRIERATLDGTSVDSTFITGVLGLTGGIAVQASSIYFTSSNNVNAVPAIGRADLNGSNVNEDFITAFSFGDQLNDLAVSGPYLYWSDGGTGNIGRSDLSGQNANPSFLTSGGGGGLTVNGPASQAIDFTTTPPADVTVGDSYAVAANGGGSGNQVTFTIDPTSSAACTVSGSTVKFNSMGTCTIDANQPASTNYNAAPEAQQSITVHAAIYWGNSASEEQGSISRASGDGGDVNNSFITGLLSVGQVVVAGTHIYWTDPDNFSIGRANLDGSGVNDSFISLGALTGYAQPQGLASDGTHLYWSYSGGTIYRANLDGTGAATFLSGLNSSEGLAIGGSYLYWANLGGTIGRVNLDGTGSENLVTGLSYPNAVAVDGSYVYWTEDGGDVGRANLDGTSPNTSFIVGQPDANGVAVDGTDIYWADEGLDSTKADGAIGHANLDGSNKSDSFVTGLTNPTGIAVDTGQ